MRLLLIRHGQTPSNVRRLLDTAAPGPALTPLGESQAAALPAVLSGERIEAIYASNLLRTQLTAAPLATRLGLEVRVRDGLRELAAGDLEMHGDGDSIGLYLGTVFAWAAGETARRMPGGETGEEAIARFDEVVAEVAAEGMTAALFSHGAAIRMWTAARAGNVQVDEVAFRELENAGVVTVTGSPTDGWRLESWTETPVGHTGEAAGSGPAGETTDEAPEPPRS
ncbi:histidine phosphatase family protein [Streptomyces spiramenti]|uniref:Histidine phosphatase family protein n=1 Tax=Streptomyces spiramenti TaxID=2720606 RepID=A0ABX1AMH1_9ACTN|nr:histidine phosphatase family protein [Streptomyces spiramenti]NJP66270.1 histidine phosphatase family protein [Streptomyces spiramenti]